MSVLQGYIEPIMLVQIALFNVLHALLHQIIVLLAHQDITFLYQIPHVFKLALEAHS